VFSGAGFLLRSPRSWPYAIVPALVLLLLTGLFAWGAIAVVSSTLHAWVGEPDSSWGRLGVSVLAWVGYLLGAILGLLVALAITPPLSSPALERIVELEEQEIGAPPRAPMSMLEEIWCGLRAQAFAAAFAVPLLGVLWVVEIFVAPAVVVTVPLKLLVTAFCLAWNLFDYPLTLRGIRMRERLRLVLAHKGAALGFGLGFALLFWFPCFGVLMLPVGVAGATRLVWQIMDADPHVLPSIERSEFSSRKQRLAPVATGTAEPLVAADH